MNTKSISEPFWINDPLILFNANNFYKFIPSSNMTLAEKYNSLTRFFIYLIIIFILLGANKNIIYILFLIIILIVIHYQYIINNDIENYNNLNCEKNNICKVNNNLKCDGNICKIEKNNTSEDLIECKSNDDNEIICFQKKSTEENQNNLNFDNNYFKRQFSIIPNTDVLNNQNIFANWVHTNPETCKENQFKCLKYEDVRFNRNEEKN